MKLPSHPTHGDQWKIYFGDAVRHADTLIGLQKQLEKKEIDATLDHVTLAIRYTRAACESLRKMEQMFVHRPSWHQYVQQRNTAIVRHLGLRRHYVQDLINRSM